MKKEVLHMKLHMQILIALGLGIKRNWHIFFGIILGILVGIFLHGRDFPVVSTVLTFIGQVFIRLIQMVVIPLVVSAIIIGIYGSVFSHIAKVPTTIMFIPACVPLIPGGNLYNMALSMISSDWSGFASNFALLALYTTGISFGLAIIGETEKIIAKCLAMHKMNN